MRYISNLILKEITDPKRVGQIGEAVLAQLVNIHFPKENIFRNVYIRCSNDKLTEIDIIAVYKRGLFVFEMKNYGGWIYGSKNDKYFTQVFNKSKKYRIFSPIKQNEYHIKCLKECLSSKNLPIYNIVVVSNHCNLRLKDIDNIIKIKEVKKHMELFIDEKLHLAEVEDIIDRLYLLKQKQIKK